MKNVKKILPYLIALLIVLFIIFTSCKKNNNTSVQPGADTINNTIINYVEDAADFANPERGIHVTFEADNVTENKRLDLATLKSIRVNQKNTLIKVHYLLRQFKSSPISQAFLNLLQDDLDACRQAGVKIMPDFRYNAYEGQPAPSAPLNVINGHLDQLAPIFLKNKDVFAWMGAGLLGAYGEWHNDSDPKQLEMPVKGQVLQKLLSVFPKDRMITIRTAKHKREIFGNNPFPASEAYSGSESSRVGHENDSYASNITDYGTYYFGEGATTAQDAELVKKYLEQEGNSVVMSGETSGLCGDFPTDAVYRQCDYAVAMFKRLKYTSISHYELLDVNAPCNTIPIWQNGGCESVIKVKLGYRFRLVDAAIPKKVNTGAAFAMSFKVANDGWANPVNPRGLQIVLRNKSTLQEYFITVTDGLAIPTDHTLDPRFWVTGKTTTVNINKPLPANIPAGDYDVLMHLYAPEISIRSRPEYAIHLANQNVWENTTGYNSLLATVKIK